MNPNEFFQLEIENKALYGVIQNPIYGSESPRVAIIFLHGWAGYRVGPHQMFIDFSNEFVKGGYSCVRFDFRGRGYSEGEQEFTSILTMLDDLDHVLRLVKSKNYKHIVLIGICSGSNVILNYLTLKSTVVDDVVLLSGFPLGESDSIERKIKQSTSSLKEYASKLTHKETWKKLISGQLHWDYIFESIGISPRAESTKNKVQHKHQNGLAQKRDPKEKYHPFSNFDGNITMIFGDKDPDAKVSQQQFESVLRMYNVDYTVRYVKGGNHSFYSIYAKEQIAKIISEKLSKKFKND